MRTKRTQNLGLGGMVGYTGLDDVINEQPLTINLGDLCISSVYISLIIMMNRVLLLCQVS